MKFNLTRKKQWILGGALLLCTATPSFAIFGLGDIVFDPTSYASLVSQLSTLTKMYTTATSSQLHQLTKTMSSTSTMKNAVANRR